MITWKYVEPAPASENGLAQPCSNLEVRVRVVDCYTHGGLADIGLKLTVNGKDIEKSTDSRGRVYIRFAASRLEVATNLTLTVTKPLSGQYEIEVPLARGEEPDESINRSPCTIPLKPGKDLEISVVVYPNWVSPPPDLDARVKTALRQREIRVFVDNGANFGNQAATADMLRAMTRLCTALELEGTDRPVVKILAKEGEWNDVNHKLTLHTQNATSTERLKDFWKTFLQAVVPGIEETAEPAEGFSVNEACDDAVLRICRPLEQLDAEELGVDEEDAWETMHAHLRKTLADARNTGGIGALGLTKLVLESLNEIDPNVVDLRVSSSRKTTVIDNPGGTLKRLSLKVLSMDEKSPRERFDILVPNPADLYVRAENVEEGELEQNDGCLVLAPASDTSAYPRMAQRDLDGYATSAKGKHVLALQPYLWKPKSRYSSTKGSVPAPLCLPFLASYLYEVAPKNDEATLLLLPPGVREALTRVLTARTSGTVLFQVAYGLHQAGNPDQVGTNLATALLNAAEAAGKKIVVFSPCKVDGFHMGFGQVEGTQVIQRGDEAATQMEGALGGDDVKVVLLRSAQGIPNAGFNQLMLRSDLPVLFEGANTAGFLITHGRPHLSVRVKTTEYAAIPGRDGHTRLEALTGILEKDDPSEAETVRLGTFLQRAAGGASEVGSYFGDAKAHMCRDQLDQLKLGLYISDLDMHPPDLPVEDSSIVQNGAVWFE